MFRPAPKLLRRRQVLRRAQIAGCVPAKGVELLGMRSLNLLCRNKSRIRLVAAILRIERMPKLISGLAADVGRDVRHPDHCAGRALCLLDGAASPRQARREQRQSA